MRLDLPHPERGGPAVGDGVLRSRAHSLRSVGWGPPPGIEDGGVAARGDPATPRWAWAGARGSAGAGGGRGSPGREREMPVHLSLPSPPSAPAAGLLCSRSPSFSNYLHRHPSSDLGSLLLTPNFSLKPQFLRLLSPMSRRRLHAPTTLNSLFHARSPIFPLSRIPFWSGGSQKAFVLDLPAASTCTRSSARSSQPHPR